MHLIKNILKKPFVIRCLSSLIAFYIKFVFKTSKWQWLNTDILDKFFETKTPAIICFWHSRLLMLSTAWTGPQNKMHMLISIHRDGLLIAETMKHFGILTVSGSSSKGGAQALRNLIQLLKNGDWVGITPDGPRGPRFKAKAGIVQIAKLSGCPIIPASYSTTRRKILSSWDRFIFALPFSKGVFIAADPIFVPPTANDKETQEILLKVENSLKQVSNYADKICGHTPIPDAEGV